MFTAIAELPCNQRLAVRPSAAAEASLGQNSRLPVAAWLRLRRSAFFAFAVVPEAEFRA